MTAYGRPPTSTVAVAIDLVHRDRALAEARDAGSIAERLGEGGAQDEGHVLDGVVLVDLEVAIGADRQVEQAVVGERAQEVVVEAQPGVDRGGARSVESERDRDRRLAGGPGEADPAPVTRADRQLTERGGHRDVSLARAWATAMSRSFS